MKIKKCVIVVAGIGSRMLPITKTVSKEMLPIIDVPTIFLQVKEAYLSGIKEIIFVVSKKNKSLIQNFFQRDYNLLKKIKNDKNKMNLLNELDEIIKNVKFTYVLQRIKGTYGALYSAKNYLKNETFALMYGDDLIASEVPFLKKMLDIHEQTNDLVVGARTIKKEELPKFGIIKYENGYLENICYKKEKNPSNDIIFGRFILNSNIFKVKDKLVYHNDELQLPKALLYIDEKVKVLLCQDNYFDIGSKIGYLKANLYYALNKTEFHDELIAYFDKIKK